MGRSIEIPDDLFRQARATAAREGVTLRSIVETALRRELDRFTAKSYQLPDLSFGGQGMVAGIDEEDWPAIRDMAYRTQADRRV